jgi:hypothetical protein
MENAVAAAAGCSEENIDRYINILATGGDALLNQKRKELGIWT